MTISCRRCPMTYVEGEKGTILLLCRACVDMSNRVSKRVNANRKEKRLSRTEELAQHNKHVSH